MFCAATNAEYLYTCRCGVRKSIEMEVDSAAKKVMESHWFSTPRIDVDVFCSQRPVSHAWLSHHAKKGHDWV